MDEAKGCDVVLQGRVAEGKDPNEVRKALAVLMKIPVEQAANLLQEKKTLIVSEVDQATAQRYHQALENTGAVVVITPHVPSQAAATQAVSTPAQAPQPAPTPAEASKPAPTQATAPQPAPTPVTTVAKTPNTAQPADSSGSSSQNRSSERPAAEKVPRESMSLPVIPVIFGAVVLVVLAVVVVRALSHDNPPRSVFLELANEMMEDVLRVNQVVMETRVYSDMASQQGDAATTSSIDTLPVSTVINEMLSGTTGEAIRSIQREMDQSGISAPINSSRTRIRERLGELEADVEDSSRDFTTAFEELKWLYAMYERFVETALNPMSRPSIVEFMGDYEFERVFFETEYLKVFSTALELSAGDTEDQELFETAREHGVQLSEESKSLSDSVE